MRQSHFSEDQISGFIKELQAGIAGFSFTEKRSIRNATWYRWRSKFGGMQVLMPSGSIALCICTKAPAYDGSPFSAPPSRTGPRTEIIFLLHHRPGADLGPDCAETCLFDIISQTEAAKAR